MPLQLFVELLNMGGCRECYVKFLFSMILIILGPWTGVTLMSYLAYKNEVAGTLIYFWAILYIVTIVSLAIYKGKGRFWVYIIWLIVFVSCVTGYLVVLKKNEDKVNPEHPEINESSHYQFIGLLAFSIVLVLLPGAIIICNAMIKDEPSTTYGVPELV